MASQRDKVVLVREAEASSRVLEIFQQIKTALGVPHVNVLFQAYAAYPFFFNLFWEQFQPLLATQEFFDLAERLRAEAFTRMHNYFKIPDLCARMNDMSFSAGASHELAETVELLHYNNSLLLLMAAAQLQGFDGPVGAARKSAPSPEHPVYKQKLVLVEENAAPPNTRKIFDEMRRTLNISVINTDYRAFARWPDFLVDYWSVLKNVAQTPIYKESCVGMRDSALMQAQELPAQLNLTFLQFENSGMGNNEIAAVVRVTQKFVNMLSGLVLNIALAKIGLEGGTTAPGSKDAQSVPPNPPPRQAA